MSELKPCPFCGGEAAWGAIENHHYVKCMNPYCHTQPTTAHRYMLDNKEKAIEAWNTRPDLKAELAEASENITEYASQILYHLDSETTDPMQKHANEHIRHFVEQITKWSKAINTIMGESE